jgi:hypothetical protein
MTTLYCLDTVYLPSAKSVAFVGVRVCECRVCVVCRVSCVTG